MPLAKTLFFAAASIPVVLFAAPVNAQMAGEVIPGSYICVFKNTVARSQVDEESQRAVRARGGQVDRTFRAALRGFTAKLPGQAVEQLKAENRNIDYCEPDRVVSIPPIRINAKLNRNLPPPTGQETPWGVARVKGGRAGTFGTAWVIDTGIDLTHPDLNVDIARSRSFLGAGSTPQDQNGHGTHVAGTIAAYDNAIGVVGVAPGARVVAVRVLDRRGSGSTSGVIAGVEYVAANGRVGDVANMSLGGGISSALDSAVVNAAAGGVKFVIAAGNDAGNAANQSPARAEGPNVYTVSAFSYGDLWASFSNYGNPPIDWAEPGVSIKSTWLSGGYNTISGTSMATPHLAGILLAGPITQDGNVIGDPDGNPDRIGTR